MKKLILGFVVLTLSFGLCFARDVDDEFEDDFEDGVEIEYEMLDGIEEYKSEKHSKKSKKSRVVPNEEYEMIDGIEEDDDSEFEIDVTNLVYTPQTEGWTIGCYFSILEFKPTFSFIQDTFEIEFSCNIVNFDMASGYMPYGVGPGVSIGYISNPFNGGIQNCVGISYVWYPFNNTHIGSLYYRFGVRSSFGSGFITEFKMPIVAFLNGEELASIANVKNLPMGLLYSLLTISVGYKFHF